MHVLKKQSCVALFHPKQHSGVLKRNTPGVVTAHLVLDVPGWQCATGLCVVFGEAQRQAPNSLG